MDKKPDPGGNRLFRFTAGLLLVIILLLLIKILHQHRNTTPAGMHPRQVAGEFLRALMDNDTDILNVKSTGDLSRNLHQVYKFLSDRSMDKVDRNNIQELIQLESDGGPGQGYRVAYLIQHEKLSLSVALYMTCEQGNWKVSRIIMMDSADPDNPAVFPAGEIQKDTDDSRPPETPHSHGHNHHDCEHDH